MDASSNRVYAQARRRLENMGPMSVRENLQVVYQLWLNRAFKKPMLTSHGRNRANALSPKVIESNDCIRYSLALMRWIHISPMILGPVIIIEVVGQPKSVLEIYTTITTCNMTQHPNNHSPDTHTSHSTIEPQDDRHQAAPKSEPLEPPNSHNQQPNLHPVSNTQTEAEHATLNSAIFSLSLANNIVPPTPFNSLNSSPVHFQNSVPDPHPNLNTDNPPPTSHMQIQNPSCPNPTTLNWTWVNGDGPFITNGVLRMTPNSSSDTESDSIIATMFSIDRLS